MFGVVPKSSRRRRSPPDGEIAVRMHADSFLRCAHGKTILVETGNGTEWDASDTPLQDVQDGDPLLDSPSSAPVSSRIRSISSSTRIFTSIIAAATLASSTTALSHLPPRPLRRPAQRTRTRHESHRTRPRQLRFRKFCANLQAGSLDLVEGDLEILPGISVARIPGHNAGIQATPTFPVAIPAAFDPAATHAYGLRLLPDRSGRILPPGPSAICSRARSSSNAGTRPGSPFDGTTMVDDAGWSPVDRAGDIRATFPGQHHGVNLVLVLGSRTRPGARALLQRDRRRFPHAALGCRIGGIGRSALAPDSRRCAAAVAAARPRVDNSSAGDRHRHRTTLDWLALIRASIAAFAVALLALLRR